MKVFKFKIEDYINSSHFTLIKEENYFKALNIVRQIFPLNKYKITFIGNENNKSLSLHSNNIPCDL